MNTPDLQRAFAGTYREARDKFLAAARAANATLGSHDHPTLRGAQGEALAVDTALLGRPDAPALVCVLAGTHGAEGFCGSGIEVALLQDVAVHAALARSGAALLLYHAVNPYGFSHLHRTNEDNVDLNRNFRDFGKPLPRNAAYAEVHGFMVPATWPPSQQNEAQLAAYVASHGAAALQAAVSGGQCDYPEGLFFGGRSPSWSNATLRAVMRTQAAARRRLVWLDIHTGLGPWGHAEKILSGPNDPALIARARAWWGNDVTSFYDGSSTSAPLSGVNFEAALDECPGVEYTGIALEYGTLPVMDVLGALRADAWLRQHPDVPAPLQGAIKQQVRDAFYGDSDEWRWQVYGQARAALFQALNGVRG
ncbi:MAG: M14 family metallopeptidase [Betaproteobacteria bacterium]